MDKFLGVGLKNALGLWFLFGFFTVIAKTLATKYQLEGLSEVVNMT